MKNRLVPIIRQLSNDITLRVYAGMCVAISEYCEGLEADDILQICELSEAIWTEVNAKNLDIYAWCKDISGVDLKKFLNKEIKRDEQ